MAEMKILLVDDSEDVIEILLDLLHKEGFKEIYSAFNGREGLVLANDIKFDLVICDLQMPCMDGIEFGKRFRKYQAKPLIIFFSSHVSARQEYEVEFRLIDNNQFIEKDYLELVEEVKKISNRLNTN